MLGRDRNPDDRDVMVDRGPSLAKGPALAIGTLLVAFGLTGLLKDSTFPSASSAFPDATTNGTSWLGFEVNGWTCFFCITAGALLLFGAAQHHLAKMMSVLVGLALAACAIIATIDGEDVLGLAAANVWTKIGWAACAIALLFGALLPRRTRERDRARDATVPATTADAADHHRRGRFGRVRDRDADRTRTGSERV
jgi:hypothetical protein